MEGSVDSQKGCFCISASAVIRPCLTITVDVYQGSGIFIYPFFFQKSLHCSGSVVEKL